MEERAMGFQKVALAPEAVQLSPGTAAGMAIGPQVVQPQPPAIVTIGVGTKMPRGVHRPGAPVRWGPGIGRHRSRGGGMHGVALTQSAVRPLREARQRFGLGGAFALRPRWHGWDG